MQLIFMQLTTEASQPLPPADNIRINITVYVLQRRRTIKQIPVKNAIINVIVVLHDFREQFA
jgi:hypothetical protein